MHSGFSRLTRELLPLLRRHGLHAGLPGSSGYVPTFLFCQLLKSCFACFLCDPLPLFLGELLCPGRAALEAPQASKSLCGSRRTLAALTLLRASGHGESMPRMGLVRNGMGMGWGWVSSVRMDRGATRRRSLCCCLILAIAANRSALASSVNGMSRLTSCQACRRSRNRRRFDRCGSAPDGPLRRLQKALGRPRRLPRQAWTISAPSS